MRQIDALGGLVRSDIEGNLCRRATPTVVVAGLRLSRGVQAALLYRLGQALHGRGLSLRSKLLLRISQLVYGVDTSYPAGIGPRLVLRHPVGIVVRRDVVLGSRVRLFQNVTLGNRIARTAGRKDGMPVVGNDVHVFAGGVLLGPVTVGRGSMVGANVVLTTSCPENSRGSAPPPRIQVPEASPEVGR